MNLQAAILLVASAVMTALANLLMRRGLLAIGGFSLEGRGAAGLLASLVRSPAFVTGVILYGLAAVVWFRVLSLAEVSRSYPVLVGLTFIGVTLGAVLLFKEQVTLLRLAGIALILAGIVVVSRN